MMKNYFKRQEHSKANYFQFENWKYSIDCMYAIDCICIVVLAIVFQTQISAALVGSTSIASKFSALSLLQQQYDLASNSQKAQLSIQIKTLSKDITNSINNAYEAYDDFVGMSLILTSYFINNIMQIIFARIRRKVVELFTVEQIINLILLYVVLDVYFMWKFDYCKRTYPDSANDRIYRLKDAFSEKILNSCTSSAIIICFQWSRVIMILSLSKTFGPMIEIIKAMIKELMVFAVMFSLVFTMFMFTGKILFFELNEFSSFEYTAQYLFYAALGNFSFSTFDADMVVNKYVGYGFIVMYVVFTNITLLNFLIAILSDIYSILKLKSSVLYYQQIVRVRQIHDYDKHYSSLVSASPPFNFIIVPFIPLIILFKSERLNDVLLYICYLPVLAIGMITFIITSFIHIPFAYISLLMRQLRIFMNNSLTSCKSFFIELLILFFILFCGAAYIFILQTIDVYFFIGTLFSKDLQMKTHISHNRGNGYHEIESELFNLIINKINDCKAETINTKELILFFRDKMRISTQISKLIFSVRVIQKKVENTLVEEIKDETINYDNDAIKYESTNRHFNLKTPKLETQIEIENQDKKFNAFVRNKSPKDILYQYNALKKFLIANSISKQSSFIDANNSSKNNIKVINDDSKSWNIQEEDSFINSSKLDIDISKSQDRTKSFINEFNEEGARVIDKSMILQTIHEVSRKDDFTNFLHTKLANIALSVKKENNFSTEFQKLKLVKSIKKRIKKVHSIKESQIAEPGIARYESLKMLRISRNAESLQEFFKS